MAEEHIGINRLKEREDANKYPRRKCVRCIRYPCFSGQGIGMVLIAIGFALCFGSAYYHGISNHEFKDGFSKGFNAGIEYIIDWAKNKKEG